MFYVIMTPLGICAILSVIWCIRSMKDNTPHRTHKYKTPKIERIDSSFAKSFLEMFSIPQATNLE